MKLKVDFWFEEDYVYGKIIYQDPSFRKLHGRDTQKNFQAKNGYFIKSMSLPAFGTNRDTLFLRGECKGNDIFNARIGRELAIFKDTSQAQTFINNIQQAIAEFNRGYYNNIYYRRIP